jgi:choline-sulfatase
MDSVTQAGPCTRTNQIDFDDEVVFAARQKLFDMARGKDERPFCLVVSMTHPHDPYTIPQAYWDRYEDSEIDLPRVTMPVEQLDPHSRRIRHVVGLELQDPSIGQIRAARHAYYGAIAYVDDQIGLLMQTLKDSGLADDTIVMVISDHGDMLGERGLWYKMTFFESGCRIPLIVHAPGRFAARRVSESASLLDLLPTLVELAHGPSPTYCAPVDGRSLLPALNGAAGPGEVLGEYLGESAISPIVMIRRGSLKFIHCPVDPDQLYDLSHDPDELVNLAADPGHAALLAEFRDEVHRRWSLQSIHEDVLASQRRRHFVYGALRKGRYQPWDHQPMRDATKAYIRNDQELNDLEAMARFPRVT